MHVGKVLMSNVVLFRVSLSAAMLSVGLAVALTLLVGVIISIVLFMLNRRRNTMYTDNEIYKQFT